MHSLAIGGIVTAFDLDETYYNKYDVQNVGGDIHNELWIPAEELPEFNQHIVGAIRITEAFFGNAFVFPKNEVLAQTLEQLQNGKVS